MATAAPEPPNNEIHHIHHTVPVGESHHSSARGTPDPNRNTDSSPQPSFFLPYSSRLCGAYKILVLDKSQIIVK